MCNPLKNIQRGKGKVLMLSSLLVLAALGPVQSGIAAAFQPVEYSEDAASDIQKKLQTAKIQHELILLLIENKTYNQVPTEWKKVLDLRLGAKYEGPIAQSLLTIGYKLYAAKQYAVVLKMIDASVASVPFSNANKADIFKFKAGVLQESGDIDNAIRAMRYASELAGK
jgi:hypothetical protein